MKSIDRFFVFLMLFAGCLMAVCCEKPVQAEPDDPDNPPVDTTGTTPVPEPDSSYVDIVQDVLYLLRKESMALEIDTCGASAAPVWASSDESVATVSSEGLVRAVAPGKAAISVACGDLYDECPVTVFYGDKKPENAYVGDYYLSDGSILGQNAAPSEIRAADVIGVVFCTDVSRMGKAEKDFLMEKGITPNGLVMAARHAPEPLRWYYVEREFDFTLDEREIGMQDILVLGDPVATYRLAQNDLNGFQYYKSIREFRTEGYEAGYYQAFSFIEEFESQVPSPEITTGWYLPSNGQWFDIIRGLGKGSIEENNLIPEGEEEFFWMNLGQLAANMNEILEPIAPEDRSEFMDYGMMFWTSSAASPTDARFISLDDNGFVCCYRYYKMEYMNVLCILGF